PVRIPDRPALERLPSSVEPCLRYRARQRAAVLHRTVDHERLRWHHSREPVYAVAGRHLVGRALSHLPARSADGDATGAVSRLWGEMEPVARMSSLPPAVAVMTKVPGMTVVKSRLHEAL